MKKIILGDYISVVQRLKFRILWHYDKGRCGTRLRLGQSSRYFPFRNAALKKSPFGQQIYCSLILFILTIILVSCKDTKPVIGISAAVYNDRVTVRDEYTNAITRAGGIPAVIPLCKDATEAEDIINAIDGLLLSGGEDIDPSYYGESVLNETVSIYTKRDTSDFLLLEAALKRGIPILGICRGEQLINIHFGGTLFQDLPVQVGTDSTHQQTSARSSARHTILIEKDSELHRLLNLDSVRVNSFHHQAVKTLAEGMKISAISSDGVIEGFEGHGVFCVQFHPESFVSAGDNTFLPIFQAFINKASKR